MDTNKKPMTIRELAGVLGMPKSTVSTALSGKGTLSTATRERVLAAAREHGYRPNTLAQRLANRVSSSLVCILSGPLDVGLGTYKVLSIQKALAAQSLEVPIYTYAGPAGEQGELLAEQVRQICQQRPRAIVCAGSMMHPAVFPELESYQRDGGIVVSYDMPAQLPCDQVIFDRQDNAYKAARCLLEHGHRKMGIGMSVPPQEYSDADYLPWNSRLHGFRHALEEFGAPVRPEWIFYNGPYEQGGKQMARRFLEMPERPTGLCIVNDYVALAFMVEVMRAGVRVPEEVSIVSHDNQSITELCPVAMTSVSHPADEIAQMVIEMLMERIEGFDGAPRTVLIQGELVPRRSVAAPPAE